MARVLNEIYERRGEIGAWAGNQVLNNPARWAQAKDNLFELGKRLRAQDDMPPVRRIKRRRTVRRRRVASRSGGRGATSYSSASGKVAGFAYRGRKRGLKSYRRNLWNTTNHKEKFRSHLTREGTISASHTGTSADITVIQQVPNDFWDASGGFRGTGTFNDTGALTIRGGECRLTMHNDMTDPLHVTVYELYFNETDSSTFPTFTDTAWDPTYLEGWYRDFKMISSREFNIREQDVVTLKRRMKPRRMSQTDWNTGYKKMYWVLKTYNPSGTTGGNLRHHASHNMTFVADHN